MAKIHDITVGDYVRVARIPDPWEGAGEEEEDRLAYVGHVGVVVEVEDWTNNTGHTALTTGPTNDICTGICLVRFPLEDDETSTHQRNIEAEALEIVSKKPAALPTHLD